jgi:hypothetical protein
LPDGQQRLSPGRPSVGRVLQRDRRSCRTAFADLLDLRWCGHDFGEGLDGQFVEAEKSDSPFTTSQRRVMAVGLAMVAAGVIAAVYFLVIVRS